MKRKTSLALIVGLCLFFLTTLVIIGACAKQAAPAPAAPAPVAPAPTSAPAPVAPAPTAPTSAPSPTTAPGKPIEFTFASQWAPDAFQGQHLQRLADKIKADSNGRIIIHIYPSGSLLSGPGTWDGVVNGLANMGASFRYEAGRTFSENSAAFTYGILNSAVSCQLTYDMYNQFPEFRAEWNEKVMKILYFGGSGPANLATNVPVRKLEEMKGMELRTPNAQVSEQLKALGAVPITIAMEETFMALQKGIVKGVVVASNTLQSFRYADLLKYTTYTYTYAPISWWVAINLDSYNKLPPDLKKVIDDAASWGKDDSLKMWSSIDKVGEDYANQLGHVWIDLEPAEQARWFAIYDSVAAKYAKAVDDKGLPGTKLMQFMRQDIDKLNKQYAK